jgi:DNA-binding NarL/FixJ family response regulator
MSVTYGLSPIFLAKDHVEIPTILLAEDDAAFLESVKQLLKTEFEVIAAVGDGEALIEAAQRLNPDIIISDISMPGLGGLQAARRLMAIQPDAKILFLTVHEERVFVDQAKKSGALGYVLKRCAPAHLIPAIREVLQGRAFVCPAIPE